MYLSCACPISQALDATSYGSAQVLVIARGIFQYILYKKSYEKDCAILFQHFMPSLAAIRQAAYLVAGRRNHGLPCRAAPPTRQLLGCLDSSQTWMRSLLKAPRLSFVIHTPRHEDTKTNEYHGHAEVRHVLPAAKAQE